MEMTARFTDKLSNEVKVQIVRDNGECVSKSVYFRDFVEMISDSMVDDGGSHMLRLGKLPKGYYDSSVDLLSPDTFGCIVARPAQVLPIQYYETVFRVPQPGLIFRFVVESGKITHSECYAVMDDTVKSDSVLYHYPFGNVYEDGHICWGNIDLSGFDNLKSMDKAVALFYGSETNSDLFHSYSSGYSALRTMLEELEKKDVFPAEWLCPVGKTVEDLEKKLY